MLDPPGPPNPSEPAHWSHHTPPAPRHPSELGRAVGGGPGEPTLQPHPGGWGEASRERGQEESGFCLGAPNLAGERGGGICCFLMLMRC